MKTRFLLALPLATALIAPLAAVAAPADTPRPPLRAASQCISRGLLLDYYDKIDGKHFAAFGGVNRRSLLKRRGAIVDVKSKFIQIPGSASPADGDLRMLQISLFPKGDEPWIAVSRIVWNQDRTPGTLNFYYGYSDDGGLREAADTLFPYKLRKVNGSFENAYLPRRGLTIKIRQAESNAPGPSFTYNKNASFDEPSFRRTN